jgi:hypothetical protein
MKIFIAQSLVHYLPDLLAFKGDVAALRASFFTRSDGFPPEPPEPLIFSFQFFTFTKSCFAISSATNPCMAKPWA